VAVITASYLKARRFAGPRFSSFGLVARAQLQFQRTCWRVALSCLNADAAAAPQAQRGTTLGSLTALGWCPTWAERFAPHAGTGCFPARICAEHRGQYRYYAEHGEGTAQVSGRFRHAAGERGDFPAVGDWVVLFQPHGDGPALVRAVLPRINKFSRKAAGETTTEQILAANLDTLLLVTSLNNDLNPRRIERYLAAAALPDCEFVLILNKCDLCDRPEQVAAQLSSDLPGVPVYAVSARTGEGMEALTEYLGSGRTVALLGSSGVGKSSLVNRLLGEGRQSVQSVRAGDDRGRHTTTHREMVLLPQGGLLIDNPGMRELQLWDGDADSPFAEVAGLAARCFFSDCTHQHEPKCAVRQAVDEGELDADRLASFHKLRRELEHLDARQDAGAQRERKQRERRIHRVINREKRRRRN
jgi:ribosome biogenesis GTPase